MPPFVQPDNTAETKEAYIAAAQKRIDDYLGKNSGVIIEYNGDFDYKEAENYSFGFDKHSSYSWHPEKCINRVKKYTQICQSCRYEKKTPLPLAKDVEM